MKKRLLFVITKSNWGGAQRYVYDLVTNLPKDQFEVAVALGGMGELRTRLETIGVLVLPLDNLQRDLSVSADVASFRNLYRTIRSYRPDIIHLNSSKAGGLGALAARLCDVSKIVFTAHGWPFLEKRNLLWRLFAFIGSWVTALLSHMVIVVSKNDLGIGKRFPFCSCKMHLIYNGIELPKLSSASHIRNAFPSGARVIGTIGELNKNKNQIALVEAAKADQRLFIAIVGEGEERAHLEAKIREYGLSGRVKLFGFIPAVDALRGFDAFALPSIKEGLPYVLLEARSVGLPIVFTSNIGGIAEILNAPDMSAFSIEQMIKKTVALYR